MAGLLAQSAAKYLPMDFGLCAFGASHPQRYTRIMYIIGGAGADPLTLSSGINYDFIIVTYFAKIFMRKTCAAARARVPCSIPFHHSSQRRVIRTVLNL